MFKKIKEWFSKEKVEDEPRPMGFVTTVNGFKDAELFEPRVEILVIPEDQQEVMGSITLKPMFALPYLIITSSTIILLSLPIS